nr:unnamed protein product [Digitaria exilis]
MKLVVTRQCIRAQKRAQSTEMRQITP